VEPAQEVEAHVEYFVTMAALLEVSQGEVERKVLRAAAARLQVALCWYSTSTNLWKTFFRRFLTIYFVEAEE
jgi:hypothetical protein